MTEIKDGRLRELRARAEAQQSRFEEAKAKLLRSDGQQIYGDVEHEERVGSLRSERNRELREIEAEARQIGESAKAKAENAANADPTEILTTEELERANAKRGFASDTADSLDVEGFNKRLRSVLAGGDKASIFAYWMAGQRKRERIIERRRETARSRSDSPGAAASVSTQTNLDEVLGEMKTFLGADKTQEIEAAKARESESVDVQLLAGYLKKGVRNAAEAYIQDNYGDVARRIGRAG